MLNKNTEKIGLFTAISFVIANMIGTGVFTSIGFQLVDISNVFAVLLSWVIGGVIAIIGADVYGELGSVMPRSGGEYHYLSEIYHPIVGYLSGFFSIVVGFAAPVALASMALGSYTNDVFPGVNPLHLATFVIIIITLIHSIGVTAGGIFQNIFTVFKVVVIVFFVLYGLFSVENPQNITIIPSEKSWREIMSPAFAVSLIYVYYSYSGWNASAYIVSELKKPLHTLPKSLLIGTLSVTILYLFLNYVFLFSTPMPELKGQIDVGFISANFIFGRNGAKIMGIFISLLLISSISSMVFIGPRIIQVMGEDFKVLGFFSKKRKNGVPLAAILSQSIISIFLLWTSSFETLLIYLGFLLNLFAFLTVLGLFIHRIKFKNIERPYKSFSYPVGPIIFLVFTLWTMIFLALEKSHETIIAVITLGVGVIFYFFSKKI